MKLGGFVIHGDNRETLGACLDSLKAVSDEVVAVDSCSTDGSAQLSHARGIRRIELPWQGYGAARACAAKALADCDYLLFLDADEQFAQGADEALRRWKASSPTAPAYRIDRCDWAELEGRRFAFRTTPLRRLFRIDAARWTPAMIVHESVGPVRTLRAKGLRIDHRFAVTLEDRAFRNERYALLWAVQAFVAGKRAKPSAPQRLAHFFQDAILHGAAFRGGADGLRLSWLVSRYHARKYDYLRQLRQGLYPEWVALYRAGAYRELFEQVTRAGPRTPGS